MAKKNIAWSGRSGTFKLRAAAVIRNDDSVLLCAVEDLDGWFLPGGKVQFGETSATALVRELQEELKLDVAVGEMLLITESLREERGAPHHEVCFYYSVPWPDGLDHETLDENALKRHRFRWQRIADLRSERFLPPEIVGMLIDESAPLRHLSFDRRDRG